MKTYNEPLKTVLIKHEHVESLNCLLRQEIAADVLTDTSLVQTISKFQVVGQMVLAKSNRFKRRNSYTVQFHEKVHDRLSYGYVFMFLQHRLK